MLKSKIKDLKSNFFSLKGIKNYNQSISETIANAKQKLVLAQTKRLLKETKNLNTLEYFKIIMSRNPSIDYKFIFELNKQIPKINSKFIYSYVRFCGDILIPSYPSLLLSQFKKDLFKVSLAFKFMHNTTLDQQNKIREYLKFLVRTNTLDKISQKDLLRNVDRIKAELINTKLSSSKFKDTCYKTYSGFINVLKTENPYFITIKDKLYLGKTNIGNSTTYDGSNKLLLDLNTLDVYKFKTENGQQLLISTRLFNFENHKLELSKEMNNYLTKLKSNYIKYYSKRTFKNKIQKEKVLKRISNIFADPTIPFLKN